MGAPWVTQGECNYSSLKKGKELSQPKSGYLPRGCMCPRVDSEQFPLSLEEVWSQVPAGQLWQQSWPRPAASLAGVSLHPNRPYPLSLYTWDDTPLKCSIHFLFQTLKAQPWEPEQRPRNPSLSPCPHVPSLCAANGNYSKTSMLWTLI